MHYKSFGFLAVLRAYVRAALRACGLTGVRRCVLAVYVLRKCGLADVPRTTLGGYDLSAESDGVKVMFWKRVDTKLSS